MGKQFTEISQAHQEFINKQKLFFVGTARSEGRVNVSPKGMDSFRVLNANQVVWLNLTGSGNETAAHLLENNRMTIMFTSFDEKPLILRLYGHAQVFHERDEEFEEYKTLFPKFKGARQILLIDVDLVQSSCGFAVPIMDFREERQQLNKWSEHKGEEGLKSYQQTRNKTSIDGFETKI